MVPLEMPVGVLLSEIALRVIDVRVGDRADRHTHEPITLCAYRKRPREAAPIGARMLQSGEVAGRVVGINLRIPACAGGIVAAEHVVPWRCGGLSIALASGCRQELVERIVR